MREKKAQLRERQLEAVLAALAARPGLTVYGLGGCVPVAPPDPPSPVRAAPAVLVISLLGELERQGKVSKERDPEGNRWYLAGETRG